jgi:hypothetical protein
VTDASTGSRLPAFVQMLHVALVIPVQVWLRVGLVAIQLWLALNIFAAVAFTLWGWDRRHLSDDQL